MPKRFFLFFCYTPDTMMYRVEELHAVCRILGTEAQVVVEGEGTGGVFMTVDFESEEKGREVCRRLTLLKAAFELWGKGGDDEYVELKASVKANEFVSAEIREQYRASTFKFVFDAMGAKVSFSDKVARFNRLSDVGLDGKIEMTDPEATFYLIEDRGLPTTASKALPPLTRVYFARLLGVGARKDFDAYSLKTRAYIGTTTMVPELCMLMANIACVKKNSLVWDPFCGTGSTLVSSAHYGAHCFGSDLDGRALGNSESGIQSNCKQYSFQPFELARTDLSKLPWRVGLHGFLDAIISDPPYGRREPRKKIDEERQTRLGEIIETMTEEEKAARLERIHTKEYIPPPKTEYSMAHLLTDLVNAAAKLLRVGGRLVYWHPTTANYNRSELPTHPALRLLSDIGQSVTIKLKRRLVVFEKTREWDPADAAVVPTIADDSFHCSNEAHDSEQYLAYKSKRAAKHAASVKYRQDNKIDPLERSKLTKSQRRKVQVEQKAAKKERKAESHAASVVASKENTRKDRAARGKLDDQEPAPPSPASDPSAKKRKIGESE
eukprot:TRINITY_DN27884_c0_g1_i1.p1 TRINITY_DN27884_c0_g1~~TRINITY_DN27884_c0_g1_i1.p1  ORF type:complete len:576 (+),score=198.21 TRINITY_DN27884_c0_g1_i1:76-1728(+)